MLERADPCDMDVGSTSLQAAVEKVAGTVLTDALGGRATWWCSRTARIT